MTARCINFYVFDNLNRMIDIFYLTLEENNEFDSGYCEDIKQYKFRQKFHALFRVDGYFVSIFSRIIKISEVYPKMVLNNFLNKFPVLGDSDINVKFQLIQPKFEVIDYSWGERVSNLVHKKQELEHAMSWLSTLGGAFSALGDSFENCAKTAGKISVHQFKIAFLMGEPPLVATCKLYMALSLMQLGKLSIAKKIIEKQYETAKTFDDFRLKNMCKGVWAKLKYSYKLRKDNFVKNIS